MYAKILKFLTNLPFKQVFRGFLTPQKKREPNLRQHCVLCSWGFMAFNKRQKICGRVSCRKKHRAKQYRARIKFAESLRKANMEAIQARDRHSAAIIIGPTGAEEEE